MRGHGHGVKHEPPPTLIRPMAPPSFDLGDVAPRWSDRHRSLAAKRCTPELYAELAELRGLPEELAAARLDALGPQVRDLHSALASRAEALAAQRAESGRHARAQRPWKMNAPEKERAAKGSEQRRQQELGAAPRKPPQPQQEAVPRRRDAEQGSTGCASRGRSGRSPRRRLGSRPKTLLRLSALRSPPQRSHS